MRPTIIVFLLAGVLQACIGRELLESANPKRHGNENSLPEAEVPDKCNSVSLGDHLVVAARYNEDISWMAVHLDVPFLAYQAQIGSSNLDLPHAHSNLAREASAYLQFIAEYYNCLPKVTAFIHGHRSSWHSPDMVKDLNALNWSAVSEYLPLDQSYFVQWGTFLPLNLSNPSAHLNNVVASGNDAYNGSFDDSMIVDGKVYEWIENFHYNQATETAAAWESLMKPTGFGTVPDSIQYYCCAQFAVPKKAITRLPRDFYLKAIYWIEHEPFMEYISAQYSKGLVFEGLWHIIFGQPAILERPSESLKCRYYRCAEK